MMPGVSHVAENNIVINSFFLLSRGKVNGLQVADVVEISVCKHFVSADGKISLSPVHFSETICCDFSGFHIQGNRVTQTAATVITEQAGGSKIHFPLIFNSLAVCVSESSVRNPLLIYLLQVIVVVGENRAIALFAGLSNTYGIVVCI